MEDAGLDYFTPEDLTYTSGLPVAPRDLGSPPAPAPRARTPVPASDEELPLPPIPPDMTQEPPAEAAPRRPSLLDLLRKRVENEYGREPMNRLADLGAGMLASGSPNFFTMLAAGTRAQSEGERTRMQELRQLADAERQAAAQQANENYRREQARIAQQRYEAEAPLRAAQAEQARAMAGFYGRRGDGTGVASDRLTATALRTAATQAEAAVNAARRARAADPTQRPLTPEEETTIWQTTYQRVIAGQNVTAPAGAVSTPPPASAPAARIDAMGRPIR